MDGDERTTRAVIDGLVQELAPVRRFPAWPTALTGLLVAWAAATALSASRHGESIDLIARSTGNPWFALALAGLALAGVAGCLAAVVDLVPGREAAARRVRDASVLGLVASVVAGAGSIWSGADPAISSWKEDGACLVLGATIGLVPMIGVLLLERRGFVQYPPRSAAIALAGAFGLGGLAVQLTCQHAGARHMLLGHVAVPVVALALAIIPLTRLLSRRRAASLRRA